MNLKTIVVLIIVALLFNSCVSLIDTNIENVPLELTNLNNQEIKEWLEANYTGPIIEGNSVTFLYYSDKLGKNDSVSIQSNHFSRYKKTNLFILNLIIDKVDNYAYTLLINKGDRHSEIIDPYNKKIRYSTRIKNILRTKDSKLSTIELYKNVKPEGPNLSRNVYVCLPPGYYSDITKEYPVLYMQDGQQIFDSSRSNNGGWCVDTTLTQMVNNNEIESVIIVGIENTSNRIEEYVGFSAYYKSPDSLNTNDLNQILKLTKGYEDFLTKELKPFIDSLYRTKTDRDNTAIAGSSFGAGLSIYMGFKYNSIYSKIGAFSGGNFPYGTEYYTNFNVYPYLYENVIKSDNGTTIYLDCGGKDVDAIFRPETEQMHKELVEKGYIEGKNLYYQINKNAGHNERSWANRFPDFLKFIYPSIEEGN